MGKASKLADYGDTVGSVIAVPSLTIPQGFLVCNGAAISRTTYADLFAFLGTTYGAGDGSTTFNIPDYRGQFLRGHDNGAGNDPDAATRTDRGDGTGGDVVGSKQADENKSHTHVRTTCSVGASTGSYGTAIGNNANPYTSINTGATGGNESRPKNVAITYVIKY